MPKNPRMNQVGAARRTRPRHSVAIKAKTWMPAGIATAMLAAENVDARKSVLNERRMDLVKLFLAARDFVPDRRRHDALLELADVVAEHLTEVLVGFNDVLELETDLRAEGRLSEEVVVGQIVAGVE